MTGRFESAHQILQQAVQSVTPAAQVAVRHKGQVVWNEAAGWLDPPEKKRPTTDTSRFDMASVTKLFASTAFMRLVERNLVSLDQPVCTFLEEFQGFRSIQAYEDPLKPGEVVDVSSQVLQEVNASAITFRDLLTHTAGLPAWRPLYLQPDVQAARKMALTTFFAYQPHSRVVYSDIGLILLGMAIEIITGMTLDQVISEFVLKPLNLNHTGYIQVGAKTAQDETVCAPTEYCQWRGRRMVAEVHDENAWRLGGISAHAGIFSTAQDIARFGQSFLNSGSPILLPSTIAEMTHPQAVDETTRRGLGFALWSPDPEASSNPFSQAAFGHTGFTGTCLWIDPSRDLVVSLLTNEVYYGRENRGIGALRIQIHQAIVHAIDA